MNALLRNNSQAYSITDIRQHVLNRLETILDEEMEKRRISGKEGISVVDGQDLQRRAVAMLNTMVAMRGNAPLHSASLRTIKQEAYNKLDKLRVNRPPTLQHQAEIYVYESMIDFCDHPPKVTPSKPGSKPKLPEEEKDNFVSYSAQVMNRVTDRVGMQFKQSIIEAFLEQHPDKPQTRQSIELHGESLTIILMSSDPGQKTTYLWFENGPKNLLAVQRCVAKEYEITRRADWQGNGISKAAQSVLAKRDIGSARQR